MVYVNKTVLILFPWPSLGQALFAEYAQNKYHPIVVLSSGKDVQLYEKLKSNHESTAQILSLGESAAEFWEGLDSQLRNTIVDTSAVINCIGHDFIRLQVEGEGENWSIQASKAEKERFAFLDILLKNFHVSGEQIWVNLVYGKAGHSDQQTFCETRYGIMGFSNLMKMIPELSGLHIIDICLTYLRHKAHSDRIPHCQRCSAEKFLKNAPRLNKPQDIARFLFEQTSRFLQQGNQSI